MHQYWGAMLARTAEKAAQRPASTKPKPGKMSAPPSTKTVKKGTKGNDTRWWGLAERWGK